jgi:hypothetical protein
MPDFDDEPLEDEEVEIPEEEDDLEELEIKDGHIVRGRRRRLYPDNESEFDSDS